MIRGFVIGVAVAIVVALAGGYVLLQSGYIPANADAKPGGPEIWAAQTSLSATLRREAPGGPNPVALSDTHLVDGVKLYAQHCAVCHGTSAGNGSESPARAYR